MAKTTNYSGKSGIKVSVNFAPLLEKIQKAGMLKKLLGKLPEKAQKSCMTSCTHKQMRTAFRQV